MSEHGSRFAIMGDVLGHFGTVREVVQVERDLRAAGPGEQRVRVPLGVAVGDTFRWHRESILAPPAPELDPAMPWDAKPGEVTDPEALAAALASGEAVLAGDWVAPAGKPKRTRSRSK